MQDITSEYLKSFDLIIAQPAKGYRYSIDSFLLADFVSKLMFNKAIEMGGGSGIISFLIAKLKNNIEKIEIFEIQKELYSCLELNLINNIFPNIKFILRNEDIKFAIPSFIPDIVFINPPFRNPKSGKVSPSSEKAFARHEFFLDLDDLFKSFKKMAGKNTSLAFIHLFERKDEIERKAELYSLYPNTIIEISPFPLQKPKHIIYLFTSTPKPINVQRKCIYLRNGEYSPEMAKILNV